MASAREVLHAEGEEAAGSAAGVCQNKVGAGAHGGAMISECSMIGL